MDVEGVEGVLVDELLLFQADSTGVHLQPDARRLLLRLRYSSLWLGLLQRENEQHLGSAKKLLLQDIGLAGALQYVRLLNSSSATDSLVTADWAIPFSSSVYVTGKDNEPIEEELLSQGWKILRVGEGANIGGENEHVLEHVRGVLDNEFSVLCAAPGPLTFDGPVLKLEQLYEIPAALALLNKKAWREKLVVVGYTMKWSRELEFLKRGAFPMVRNCYGISFVPVEVDRPLDSQLTSVDVILHKATDEIVSVIPGQFETMASVEFSAGIQELQRYLQEHAEIRVVDPIEQVLPLLDRVATQAILKDLKVTAHQIIRAPRSVEVITFEESGLSQALESGNITLPAIVKPRIACGASEAHTMAIVFTERGFRGLRVPLPAIIQEYVDHGAFQYKVYVVGSKVMYSRRKSTPNAAELEATSNGSSVVLFDSLKSLPVSKDSNISGVENQEFDYEAVQKAATWLQSKLGLTILGFDIVVQSETKEYVIVDVNYFPSFKDVPDEEAVQAFWKALSTAHV